MCIEILHYSKKQRNFARRSFDSFIDISVNINEINVYI